jgi:hypothetical protein
MKYGGILSILLVCTCSISWAQNGYSVLMQESPLGAGEIKPGIGVHEYGDAENVTITTAPKKGYHFVTWLGDVADPTANRTQLTVDGPKIIIAVFERDQYDLQAADSPQISAGPEAMYPRSDTYTNSNGTWDPPADTPEYPSYDPPDNPPPTPVPEPLSLCIIGLGAAYLSRKQLLKKVNMLL